MAALGELPCKMRIEYFRLKYFRIIWLLSVQTLFSAS